MARSDHRIGITQGGSRAAPEQLEEVESVIEEDADVSYSEDFADGTGTGTLDRSEPRLSAAASPLDSPRSRTSDKDASYSEDFAEATLEATMEEALPSASGQSKHPTLDRRQEIALRQQADAQKTVIVAAVSDDDIEEEDIPDVADFSDDDLEGSGSMYDPEARRREMEKEAQMRQEEERLRREREQAEQARKQLEIEEANRRIAAERRRKQEEEERKRAEQDAYRRKQEEELRREEAKRREEEEHARRVAEAARKREEEEAAKKLEERRKAEEEARRREDEEQRQKAAEEARRREDEERKKAEEEARRREDEEQRRRAEEEALRRRVEEEHREAQEQERKKQEDLERQREEQRRLAEEEARANSEAAQAKALEEHWERSQNPGPALQLPAQVRANEAGVRQLTASAELPEPAVAEALHLPRSSPGLRRFSGAWIQTELEPTSADDGEAPASAGAANPATWSQFESEPWEHSERWNPSDAWSSPKRWDSERRTASTMAEDRPSQHTGRSSSTWDRADSRGGGYPEERREAWQPWSEDAGGSWWRDWEEPRKELRLPFEAGSRDSWSQAWALRDETWNQRCSRDWEAESPSHHWDHKTWMWRAEKENHRSQLEWDRVRERRSPTSCSGLWQHPRSQAPESGVWPEAARCAGRPFEMPQMQGSAAGIYGHATPFGVLYPWTFPGYPGQAPGPCVPQPSQMMDSVTLSPTGSRPEASPGAPAGLLHGEGPERPRLQLRERPRSWSAADGTAERPALVPGDDGAEPSPKPATPNKALETTLVVGSPDLDFQESLVGSLAAVVDDMLQFKYGCNIDTEDYRAKLLALCDATALCSIPRLVDYANSRTDLWASDSRCAEVKLQLRLACQELTSFGDLSQRLRLLQGTASATAVISTRGGYAVQALAAFRTSCSDARHAVGRCGTSKALEHFSAEEFCSAVALEPAILSVQAPAGSPGGEVPRLTKEFRSLKQLLEGRGQAERKPRLSPQLLAVLHARAPSALAFRHVAGVLESPDLEPDVVLELFRRMVEWFGSKSPFAAAAAQRALAEAPAQVALVACLRRDTARQELCQLGCQLIARAARHHVENAAAFVNAGAAQLICHMLARHFVFKELQRYGLQALAMLAHCGGGASQAVAADAVRLTLRALAAHRGSASVQISGCDVLRCLAELGEAPLDELAEAAQLAKRAFPEDAAVHRAADGLLSFAIPRSAAAIGSLMDAARADETAQRNAICSLGHLAGYGGVAWRGASRVALNRILRAMAQHKGSPALVASGLWALARFAERVDAPPGGLQDAAQQAKASHANSALVCRHADELIAYLMRPK